MIGNKIADKITKVSRTLPQNSLETVTNGAENIGFDREVFKEIYIYNIYLYNIIYNLRLVW